MATIIQAIAVTTPAPISISFVQEFSLLHVLANIWHCLPFNKLYTELNITSACTYVLCITNKFH